MALYNSVLYDQAEYNLTEWAQLLTDSVSSSDTVINSVSKSLSDAQSLSDSFDRIFSAVRTLVETISESDSIVKSAQPMLSDSILGSDDVSKFIKPTLTEVVGFMENFTDADYVQLAFESVALIELLSKNPTLAPLLETIQASNQWVKVPSSYGLFQYNSIQYNTTLKPYGILFNVKKSELENILLADNITEYVSKLLQDSLVTSDVYMDMPMQMFNEFLFTSESFKREISNKALNDVLRINDWLSIKFTPFVEYWGN